MMAIFKLSRKSISKLDGVHEDLVAVVKRAIEITAVDFAVTDGLRSVERQKQLIKEGKSQTINSRHLSGRAVDLAAYVGGKIVWDESPYHEIAKAMFAAADELNVKIVWGGNWKTLKDFVHFELDKTHKTKGNKNA